MIKGDAFLGFRVEKCAGCNGACGEATQKGSGDFTDCMQRIVPKAKPDDPEAFCAWYEHEQTGSWPGEKRASIHRDTFLDGPGADFLEKVWSDEAREAAAEARRNNARARSRDEGGPVDVIKPDKPEGEKKPE